MHVVLAAEMCLHACMQYTPVDVGMKRSKDSRLNVAGPLVMRIQDRPLQEMRDEGNVCMCVRCMCVGSVVLEGTLLDKVSVI